MPVSFIILISYFADILPASNDVVFGSATVTVYGFPDIPKSKLTLYEPTMTLSSSADTFAARQAVKRATKTKRFVN